MNVQQAKAFEALIWCPDSNFFLLNTTAKVDKLKKEVAILFGTDSTVSANWNAWEQIRLAQKTKMFASRVRRYDKESGCATRPDKLK